MQFSNSGLHFATQTWIRCTEQYVRSACSWVHTLRTVTIIPIDSASCYRNISKQNGMINTLRTDEIKFLAERREAERKANLNLACRLRRSPPTPSRDGCSCQWTRIFRVFLHVKLFSIVSEVSKKYLSQSWLHRDDCGFPPPFFAFPILDHVFSLDTILIFHLCQTPMPRTQVPKFTVNLQYPARKSLAVYCKRARNSVT